MGNLLGTIKVGTLVKREDIQSARSRPKRALTASRPLPALDDIDDDLLPSFEAGWVRVIADLNLHSYEEFEAEAKDMTADSTVGEIEASRGTALGLEVDVCDQETEPMVARVLRTWPRIE